MRRVKGILVNRGKVGRSGKTSFQSNFSQALVQTGVSTETDLDLGFGIRSPHSSPHFITLRHGLQRP